MEVSGLKRKWQSFIISVYAYVLKESINFQSITDFVLTEQDHTTFACSETK